MKVRVTLLLFDVPASHSSYPPWTETRIFSMEKVCTTVCKNLFSGRVANPVPAVSDLYICCVCALLTVREALLNTLQANTRLPVLSESFFDPKAKSLKV